MSNFTFVELCAGVGGVSFGFEKLGGECLLAAEYDPERKGKRQYAQEAYQLLHPGTPMAGDIFELMAEDVPDHDLLSFTTPCQSFSVAGKRGGFEDVRGTVYFEAMRIARAKKPKVIFMENVKGLVGHDKGKTLDTIIQVASDSGYYVDFNVVNSKYFDVAQNRERFFMIGVREDIIEGQPWANMKGSKIVPKAKRRISEYEGIKTFNFEWPEQSEVRTKLVDFLEESPDESLYLPDEKVEQLVAKLDESDRTVDEARPVMTLGRLNKSQNGRQIKDDGEESFTLTAQDRHGVMLPAEPPFCVHNIYGGFNESKPRVFGDESPTIRTSAGGGHIPSVLERDVKQIGYIDKNMQGNRVYDSEGVGVTIASQTGGLGGKGVGLYTEEIRGCSTRSRNYRGQGEQLEVRDDEVSNTVTSVKKDSMVVGLPIREATKKGYAVAEEGDAVNYKFPSSKTRRARVGKQVAQTIEASAFSQGVVECEPPRYRIRKLSSLECFRLQSFPDEAHRTLSEAGFSDSQLYKFAGNAVTVNVIEALGRNILPYISDRSE